MRYSALARQFEGLLFPTSIELHVNHKFSAIINMTSNQATLFVKIVSRFFNPKPLGCGPVEASLPFQIFRSFFIKVILSLALRSTRRQTNPPHKYCTINHIFRKRTQELSTRMRFQILQQNIPLQFCNIADLTITNPYYDVKTLDVRVPEWWTYNADFAFVLCGKLDVVGFSGITLNLH